MKEYILALDQGTTSSRSIIFDHKGKVKSIAQQEFKQIFPQPAWVEHDGNEIWESQKQTAINVMKDCGISAKDIAGIGITNQRETTLVWNRKTHEPICNAIVWQDRRTADFCDSLKEKNLREFIQQKTGLIIDAYFSATKLRWILDNVKDARQQAEEGELCFGTIDCWLLFKLTNGQVHATDVSNASRTMLFNIYTLEWDDELLDLFNIPKSVLPSVRSSSEVYGETDIFGTGNIPICGIAGDQQAALFGQLCIKPGMVKNTYGTGCFMLMNTGEQPVLSKNNLLTTIAWKLNDKVMYALEGSVFIGGAVVQWLRDGLGAIKISKDVEQLAVTVPDNGGVYFVPAFTGLGAPHWNQDARGAIFGLTRGSTAGHIARAAIESICYQTMDVLNAMNADAGITISELRVDGGATANDLLMQFQSNMLNCKVVRPEITETTALGAAYLAGLAIGFWKSVDEINNYWTAEQTFEPDISIPDREKNIHLWNLAVKSVTTFT